MAGIPAPIDEIREFYDGYIIEDCAHSTYTPGAGTKGDIAVWSFQAVKTMPIGDGGMITTNDYDLYQKLQSLAWFVLKVLIQEYLEKLTLILEKNQIKAQRKTLMENLGTHGIMT